MTNPTKHQVGGDRYTSDGSTADYYQLPPGCTELQHLISHRNMNAQDGEIFRAIYRKGRASHSDELRDAKKVLFYAKAEVERLEKLRKPVIHELYSEEVLAAWEEGEKRMDQIGPNGNDGMHYWQINRGVTPPHPRGTRVMVEFRNGDRDTDDVHEYNWSVGANGYDIIRWRLA